MSEGKWRIISDGTPSGTKVCDAEGNLVRGIREITVRLAAGELNQARIVTVSEVVELDVQVPEENIARRNGEMWGEIEGLKEEIGQMGARLLTAFSRLERLVRTGLIQISSTSPSTEEAGGGDESNLPPGGYK